MPLLWRVFSIGYVCFLCTNLPLGHVAKYINWCSLKTCIQGSYSWLLSIIPCNEVHVSLLLLHSANYWILYSCLWFKIEMQFWPFGICFHHFTIVLSCFLQGGDPSQERNFPLEVITFKIFLVLLLIVCCYCGIVVAKEYFFLIT